ncbi:MAG: glycosyltransferase family 2 protein [Burkholderiaceae bacterium]|nr:glycosyltransferase family 2 protein [Burkholderiaceae bacterium]
MRLSVAIIALNEERNLPDCLASVAFADEIVVVDGGSHDLTREIAASAGARVIEANDWQGFGVQKNRAVDACTGDWILSIDADERVSAALRDEIGVALRAAVFDAYEIPRSSYYCGRFMKHSGWWPDYVRRLFKRGAARFSDAPVHESLQTDGGVGRFTHPLEHWSFRTMEDVLDKVNRYSSLSAPIVIERGGRPTLLTAVVHGAAAFLRTYVLKRGFLDGAHGFMLAVSNAEGSYYRYVKAMLLAQQVRRQQKPDQPRNR